MRLFASTLVALALASTGCFGSSPPSRFFLLSPSPEGAAAMASMGQEGALGVLPTRIAAYLDRPQIVTFRGDNSVDLDEFNRWAEPLGAGVSRVLAQDLSAMLPAWRVMPQPWDPTVPLRARLVVEVTALGWNHLGEARLEANNSPPPASWPRLAAGWFCDDRCPAPGRTPPSLRRACSSPSWHATSQWRFGDCRRRGDRRRDQARRAPFARRPSPKNSSTSLRRASVSP
jgi:uncharacterized lipoprotein YmbA